MEPDTISYHAHCILALEQDIQMFGAAGDDIARLEKHKKRLEELRSGDSK